MTALQQKLFDLYKDAAGPKDWPAIEADIKHMNAAELNHNIHVLMQCERRQQFPRRSMFAGLSCRSAT